MNTRQRIQKALPDGTNIMIIRRRPPDRLRWSESIVQHNDDGSLTLVDNVSADPGRVHVPAEHVQFFVELVALDHSEIPRSLQKAQEGTGTGNGS